MKSYIIKQTNLVLSIFFFFFLITPNSSLLGQDVKVNGYYRSNGTYVKSYYRTRANSTVSDNYSTYGNVNPYTGKPGYKHYNSSRNYTTSTYNKNTSPRIYPEPNFSICSKNYYHSTGNSSNNYITINFAKYKHNKWVVSVSNKDKFSSQKILYESKYPNDSLQRYYNKDYYITDISYSSSHWFIVLSKNTTFNTQVNLTRSNFPSEEIKEYWDKDYYITNITWGNNIWSLTMSKMKDQDYYSRQNWFTNSNFPEEKIKEYWDKNYYITSIDYNGSFWTIVMTQCNNYVSVRLFTSCNVF